MRLIAMMLILGVAGGSTGEVFAQQGPPARFAIQGVTIIDVESGERVGDQTVVVTGNRITEVGPSAQVNAARMRVIEGSGRFLIPGMWEMHAHALQHYGVDYAYGMDAFQLFIANGVTGVRDAGSAMDQVVAGRRRIAETGVAAPRIFAAGPILEGNGQSRFAPFTKVVTTPEEGRLAVTALRDAGADWVKIHNALTRETYLAVAEEAAIWAIHFSGHVPEDVTMVEAAVAGQTSLEHLGAVFAYCTASRGQRVSIDREKCEAGLSELSLIGTFLGPTLVSAAPLTASDPRASEDRLQYIKPSKVATWAPLPDAAPTDRQDRYELSQELTRMASDAGVRLIVSTDTGGAYRVPGFASIDELVELVNAGVSTIDALRAGTLYPVMSLGLEDSLGTVEAGKLADLVLLEGDPLADIRNLRRIAAVVSDGRVFEGLDREALFFDVRRSAAR